MVAEDPGVELFDERGDGGVAGVEEEDLVGGDDGFDVLQVDDDGPLTAQHGGWVGEERIEDAEVAGGEAGASHDGVLPGLHHLLLPGGVQEQPCPHPRPLLPAYRIRRPPNSNSNPISLSLSLSLSLSPHIHGNGMPHSLVHSIPYG